MTANAATMPSAGPVKPLNLPQTTRFTLSNGLSVVALHMPNVPIVTMQMSILAGDAYSPEGMGGLYGAVCRLLTQGCGGLDAVAFSQRLDDYGANLQAHGGVDFAGIGGSCLAEYLPDYLKLAALMVTAPRFDEQEVMIDQQNTLQELAYMRSLPSVMARQYFNSELYGDHPYGAMLPSDEQVLAAGAEQLRNAHKLRYVPQGATLVIVGQFDPSSLLETVQAAFGEWVGVPDGATLTSVPSVAGKQRVILVDRPGSVQVDLKIGQLAVAGDYPNNHQLSLFNAAFGGRAGSVLFMNVREKHGYAYSVGSSFGVNAVSGQFSMSAQVRNDVVGDAIRLMLEELHTACHGGLSSDQLQAAKNYIDGQFCISTSTQNGIAGRVLHIEQHGRPEDDLYTYRQRIQQTDASALVQTLNSVLNPDINLIVAVGDAAAIKPQLDPYGEVTVVKPS
ncbi:MAG: M16 family metallopeptidase [Armatimonadota bacterium]